MSAVTILCTMCGTTVPTPAERQPGQALGCPHCDRVCGFADRTGRRCPLCKKGEKSNGIGPRVL